MGSNPTSRTITTNSYAASSGHGEVVKILLGRRGVNPGKPDNDGQTPLKCATLGGHEGVVKILPWREKINPDKLDNNGWSCRWREMVSLLREGLVYSSIFPSYYIQFSPSRNFFPAPFSPFFSCFLACFFLAFLRSPSPSPSLTGQRQLGCI